jgi:hypothetical protein
VGFDRRQLRPAELFKHPLLAELVGIGFDKLPNTRYFALWFPPVLKIHGDRSFKDTIGFNELQEMAKRCSEVPEDSEEETRWLRKWGYPIRLEDLGQAMILLRLRQPRWATENGSRDDSR